MRIEAIQLGESINIKAFTDKFQSKVIAKDPWVLKWNKNSTLFVFRYGAAVLWNFSEKNKAEVLDKLSEYVKNPLKNPPVETLKWKKSTRMRVRDNTIQSWELDIPSKQLIAVSLARTVVLELMEQKVDNLFLNFSSILTRFRVSGHFAFGGKKLLKLAGSAMSINHQTVSQLAMLDKPDFTWDDPDLDALYLELEEEYELASRLTILSKKLETLRQDSEFIMNILESKHSNFLELIIVILFILDIVLILFEKA